MFFFSFLFFLRGIKYYIAIRSLFGLSEIVSDYSFSEFSYRIYEWANSPCFEESKLKTAAGKQFFTLKCKKVLFSISLSQTYHHQSIEEENSGGKQVGEEDTSVMSVISMEEDC